MGFILMRTGFPELGFWSMAERVNYFLLFPALLVSSLVDAPLHDPAILRLGGAAVLTICVAALALHIARRFFPMPGARFGAVLQGAIRFNTYLGLAIVYSLAGTDGLHRAAVYLAIAVPLVNVLAIMAFSDAGTVRNPMMMIRTMLRNPLILACLVGMFLALTGIGLPFGGKEFLGLLAQGSLPLGLLCVGAALRPKALRSDALALTGNSALRLLAMPFLAALMARLFGLGGAEAAALVVFSAIPTAPTSYVLTRQMNGDGTFMAGVVTAQTVAAVLTIPLVLWVLGYGASF